MHVGWYARQWWEIPDDVVTCSLEELRDAVESSYYISTESLQFGTSPDLTVANIVSVFVYNLPSLGINEYHP